MGTKVYNRLRDLRKNDLGLKSMDALADLIDDHKVWYNQRIQRLETGETRLTDEDAHDLAIRLNVPLYTLFASPDEVASQSSFKPDVYKEIVSIIHEYNEINSVKSDPVAVTDLALNIYENEKDKMTSKGKNYTLNKEAIVDFMKLLNKLSA